MATNDEPVGVATSALMLVLGIMQAVEVSDVEIDRAVRIERDGATSRIVINSC